MNNLEKTPRKLKRELIRDPETYVESVGKQDERNLYDMLANPSGEGTVLRVIFGASEKIPFRALGLVAAAGKIARHIPYEQLQIVCATHVGERINGVPQAVAREQFTQVRRFGFHVLQKLMPDVSERTIFAYDSYTDQIADTQPKIEEVLAKNERLRSQLEGMGNNHGSNHVTYGAAHIVYQDTDALQLETNGADLQIPAERIVSIGGTKERPFYMLRMAVRGLMEEAVLPSAQVFTKHVHAPYYLARNGEPTLDEVVTSRQLTFEAADSAAQRDLTYLGNLLQGDDHA